MTYIILPHITFEDRKDQALTKLKIKYYFMESIIQDDEAHLRDNYTYMIGDLQRLGVLTFMTMVEKQYTNRPDDFQLVGIHKYSGKPFVIFGIPAQDNDTLDSLGKVSNIRLVNGRPFEVGGEHFKFSYAENSVFTLENITHPPSECYINELVRERVNACKLLFPDK